MNVLEDIKEGITKHFDKRKQDREMMEKLQKEADLQQAQIFQEEFKRNALEVAKARAKKQAAELSGLQRLRATNRARRLTESGTTPGSFFSKLSEYTQKNIANREANLKRTAEMRGVATEERKRQLESQQKQRQTRMQKNKPFGNSTWKQ